MSYVNNQGGGWGSPTVRTADNVDHIADKIELACDMVSNASITLDALQQELMSIANQPYPPQPAQLIGIATRIQASKRQIDDGLMRVKEMARTIDSVTDSIQSRGW